VDGVGILDSTLVTLKLTRGDEYTATSVRVTRVS
jgi:hypothetical protein